MRSGRPQKRLAQHFLADQVAADRIAEAAGAGPDDLVIEIGPGRGAITGRLAGIAGRLVGIELDADLCEGLAASLGDRARILHADCLQVDLPDLVREEGRRCAILVGNLPYNITGAIIERVLAARKSLVRAVLMVQREVARRITASPGGRDYGVLSLAVQTACVPQKLFDLRPGHFDPPPKVHSSVLRFPFDQPPPLRIQDEARFFRVVRAAFGQRRKMLRNSLMTLTEGDAGAVVDALEQADIDPRLRAESLSAEAFEHLAAAFGRVLPARGMEG